MKMVSISDAMAMTGHVNKDSFQSWVARYNRRNPGQLILRRWGKVDEESLQRAIEYQTSKSALGESVNIGGGANG